VKFELGGNFGLGILAAGSPMSVQVDCSSGAIADDVEATSTAGASSLSYDSTTDTYNYVWKTEPMWAGSCRTLRLTLDDGSVHEAQFRFRA
jgi:hypothetical protein